jgi:hypothetical protein
MKKSEFRVAAVANNSGAMEQIPFENNGRSSTSQKSRGNIFNWLVVVVAIVVSTVFTSCGGKGKMILKAETDHVYFGMSGTDVITLDWGDGTRETHELGRNGRFNHKYSASSVHTITITGKCTAITSFRSNLFNNLKSLDVSKCTALTSLGGYGDHDRFTNMNISKCPALTYLDCTHLDMDTDAVNALLRTLHSNSVDKTIRIHRTDCDISIATKKGWTVHDY